MKANFRGLQDTVIPDNELDKHAEWLARPSIYKLPGSFRNEVPDGYEGHYCVDVVGDEFVWMNESFPKEKYTWYLWFESVFIATPERSIAIFAAFTPIEVVVSSPLIS